jgi:two-component system, LytTR family, sensor kinase
MKNGIVTYLRKWEFWALVGLYFVFGFLYWLALYVTSYGNSTAFNILVDYSIKAILTVPFYLVTFRLVRNWPTARRLALHLILGPLYAFLWQQIYYLTLEGFERGHLEGNGSFWDIYIPLLFYFIQFGLFHIYEYYQQVREQEHKAAALRESALSNELTALKAQLNPHFLYNTFNTISASVPPEQEHTRELIADLSDLFRYQLMASKTDLVPLHEEFGFVANYLTLEKERFGDRLELDLDMPDNTRNLAVPPMILQPLAENAIRHGIAHQIDGGKVWVRARKEPNGLHLEVGDTGPGFKKDAAKNSNGIGLANTSKRLQLEFGVELQQVDVEPRGCLFSFVLPVIDVEVRNQRAEIRSKKFEA